MKLNGIEISSALRQVVIDLRKLPILTEIPVQAAEIAPELVESIEAAQQLSLDDVKL